MRAFDSAIDAIAGHHWADARKFADEDPVSACDVAVAQSRRAKPPSFLFSGVSSAMKAKAGALAERLTSVTAV